jgi:hypothetical protein
MSDSLKRVDHSALFVNQVVIITLNVLAFVLNAPWLAVVVTAAMIVGTVLGVPGFGFAYRYALRPAGIVKPNVLLDNPEPHRFSQGLGAAFMLAGTLSLFAGNATAGWALLWLVSGLAALNAFGGFCAGCFVYYWLTRLGLPGFTKAPPNGAFPGMKPRGALVNEP